MEDFKKRKDLNHLSLSKPEDVGQTRTRHAMGGRAARSSPPPPPPATPAGLSCTLVGGECLATSAGRVQVLVSQHRRGVGGGSGHYRAKGEKERSGPLPPAPATLWSILSGSGGDISPCERPLVQFLSWPPAEPDAASHLRTIGQGRR